MPDYIRCNETSESTTTPLRACDCGVIDSCVIDSSKEATWERTWREVGSSNHRTSIMASMVISSENKPKNVGVKHASYARYLAKKKAAVCCQ